MERPEDSRTEPVAPSPASTSNVSYTRAGGGWGRGMGGVGMGEAVGGGFSLRNLRTFSSLTSPVFRLYYGAMLGQMAAQNMQMMARSLLIYRLTGSAALLGVMSLANALPMLFLSLYGGVIADRVQKKYVILVGELGSAVVALSIALTLTLGYLSDERAGSWWILIVASLAQGAIFGFMMPSRQAMIPEMVGEDRVMNAVALNAFGMNMLRLAAPAAAGFLVDMLGFEAVFYTMTGLYLMAAAFIALMPLTGKATLSGRGALADMAEGFRYVRRETVIFLILVVTLLTVLLSMPYMTLLPIFTEDILNVGATGLGVLISVSGIGAMVGSITLASLPDKRRGLLLLVCALILGLALVGFSFSTSWHLSLIMIGFVGLGQAGRMALGSSLLMYYVEGAYLGRVMSFYMMEFGLTSFSVFLAALMAEAVGVQWSVGGLAIVLVFLCVGMLVLVPRFRRLD